MVEVVFRNCRSDIPNALDHRREADALRNGQDAFVAQGQAGRPVLLIRGVVATKSASAPGDAASDTMNDVGTQTETNPPGVRARLSELTADVQRGFVAEWAVTIILLLFGTTTLVQAFVIPSASMEGTLLIGDHVLEIGRA